jgi:ABC-2 type transport system permease protein
MTILSDMIWIELRKAWRSRMPLGTALASLFMPLGIGFLIFVSRNPQVSQKLGLISAKADLVKYSATDWPAYLALFGMIIAAGGFLLFTMITSWVFGREFNDGTVKDMLAVPVPRSSILLAKYIVVALWSAALTLLILSGGLVTGLLMNLPYGSLSVLFHGGAVMAASAGLAIVVTLPFAFFASAGRGYLVPIGVALLTLMMTQLAALIGRGEYFPWAIPGLYAQATPLTAVSYVIVIATGLLGMLVTDWWWMNADQSR